MDQAAITRRSLLASGAAGIVGLAGCSGIGQSEPPWGQGESVGGYEIRIGALIPQSGRLGEFGPGLEQGIRLVERQFQQLPDLDYVLDIAVRDTESDPETAVSAAQELVDEGYKALVGPGAEEALAPVTEDVLIPDDAVAVSPLAASGVAGVDDEDRLYTVATPSRRTGEGIGRPISLNRIQSVSLIYSNTIYGDNIRENALDMLDARGIDLLAEVAVGSDAASVDSALDEAMTEDPEGLILACDPGDGIPLLETYFNDFDPVTTFLTDRLRIRDLPERVGQGLVGANVVSLKPSWDRSGGIGGGSSSDDGDGDDGETGTDEETEPESDLLQPFTDAFKHAYDRFPNLHDAQGYDSGLLLALSAVAAGETNYGGEQVANRIESVAYPESLRGQVLSYGHDDYWNGIGEIEDGLRNNLIGASGTIRFDKGERLEPYLHVALFDPETESGFEDEFPLAT